MSSLLSQRLAQWRAEGWSAVEVEIGKIRYLGLMEEEGKTEEYAFVRTTIERDFYWYHTCTKDSPYRGSLPNPFDNAQAMVNYLNRRGVKESCVELVIVMFGAVLVEGDS